MLCSRQGVPTRPSLVGSAVGYQLGSASLNRHAQQQPTVSGLDVPAEWVAPLTEGLEEVMNAESLELQAVLRSDHLARSPSPCNMHIMACVLLACYGLLLVPLIAAHLLLLKTSFTR